MDLKKKKIMSPLPSRGFVRTFCTNFRSDQTKEQTLNFSGIGKD